MGRKSLNRTYKEMLEIQRNKANEYYRLHRDEVNRKRRKKYSKLKDDSIKHEK